MTDQPTLRAVDPGGKCAGWALFDVNGCLIECGLSRSKGATPWDRLADHRKQMPDATVKVCERMEFRGGKNRGSPQILIDLNLIAGALADEWFPPSEWKGTVPKEIHQPRILSLLTEGERAIVEAVMPESLRHNAIDAVGIGLYKLGRMQGPGSLRALAQAKRKPKKTGKRARKVAINRIKKERST